MANPVLIEVTRGPLIESRHRGSIALARADGTLALSLGDISSPVFPRSAIKALQSLQLVESGAAAKFGFGPAEIALACASHTGTERHTAIAAVMLEKSGLAESNLECGAHPPLGTKPRRELWSTGGHPNQLHNNCSGKHAGMLAVARHLGEPLEGYTKTDHPIQQRIHALLCQLSNLDLGDDVLGMDGCSLPNWAMPLENLAHVFAKMVSGNGLSQSRNAAFTTIFDACWSEPELIAGPGRTDTMVMRDYPGEVFIKTGAEGVYCGGLPKLGLGFALKIDDGTTRASAGTATAIIESLLPNTEQPPHAPRKILKSWNGDPVGEMRSGPDLKLALDNVVL